MFSRIKVGKENEKKYLDGRFSGRINLDSTS